MAKEIAYKVTVDTSEVDENVEKTTDSVEDLGDAAKKTSNEMKSGFKAAEQGTKSLGTSIGGLLKSLGLIGVAMAVFEFMRDIISKNQKVMDALNTATTALEIILYKIFDAVEPIGGVFKAAFEDPLQSIKDLANFIKERFFVVLDGFINQWVAVADVIQAAVNLDWDGVVEGAKDYGEALTQMFTATTKEERDAIIDFVVEFADEVAEGTKAAIDQAQALVNLRNEVILLEAEQRKLMLTYQNEAEIQRQIRDDISLTIAERLAANEELGRVLDEQTQKEEAIALRRLELAKAEAALNQSSIELQAAVIDAETELADVRERINGQRSEQLTNQKALEQELFDFQEQLRLETLEGREREIEELNQHYNELSEIARKAGEDRFEIEAQRANALNELNKKFYDEDKANAIKAEKEKAAAQKKINDAKVQAASDIAGSLGTIASAVEEQGKAGLIASKVLTTAQIFIDTAKAISGAIAQAQSVPFPGNIAAIAVGIASVVAGIASAVTTLKKANVSGPDPTVPNAASVTAAATAPQITPVTTNTTELGNTEQAELAPIQAFVVETQLTDTQNDVGQIEGQAEFGLGG